ncbi:globin [Aestuariirhabdus litorea]|uniref:Globin n=1 Tax=Aestuariirhabdus litorea TaxID=2528527 RepID=A0A3P3VTP5_9GAMM|nr:globin [Aestuariirhabdus litorea]RRJ84829.1 globin [Aestuariirhabdus litorea]RWW98054.1 globin [Endozoicomonadaceae bacterium GTF-13]
MSKKDDLINQSLERCMKDGTFMDHFYQHFIDSDPRIAEKFTNTDMDKQKRMMDASLHMLMLLSADSSAGMGHLRHIGKTHSREHHNINPDLYDCWFNSLMQTVREYDSELTPEIETAWADVLKPGMENMRSMY